MADFGVSPISVHLSTECEVFDMKKVLLRIMIGIMVAVLFFTSMSVIILYTSYSIIAGERVRDADDVPEYSGEVEAVRITSIPRTQVILAPNCEYVQILYGYRVNGIWTDLPMENYPFHCLHCSKEIQCVYSHAANTHIARVSTYAVICIETTATTPPYDNMGTEPLEPFLSYTEVNVEKPGCYGILMEDRTSLSFFDVCEYSLAEMKHRYYFVLNLDDLPDDYRLCYVDDENETHIITLDDIRSYIST